MRRRDAAKRRTGRLAVVVPAVVGTMSLSCEQEPICPASWVEGVGVEGRLTCDPPDGYAEDVADRIGSGFFGYALGCVAESSEVYGPCELRGLAGGSTFELRVEAPTQSPGGGGSQDPVGPEDYFPVAIDSDGTFELPAIPGATYYFPSELAATDSPNAAGPVLEEMTVEEGQVVFIRVSVHFGRP